jgi:predicted HAD superfamily Cof-like phosphohydrolase
MTNFDMVREFMKACDQKVETHAHMPDNDTVKLRYDLIREELNELHDGIADENLVEIADALTDLLYVVYGAGHAFGIDLDACFSEVHSSNMSKLVDGRAIKNETGKVMKPATYVPPNLLKILKM